MALWEGPCNLGFEGGDKDEWGVMETMENTWRLTALPPMVRSLCGDMYDLRSTLPLVH